MKPNWIKIASAILPPLSMGVGLLLSYVEKKELDAKIVEEVAKQWQSQTKDS